MSGNVVQEVGPPGDFLGLAVGIGVVGPFDAVSVSDNTSERPAPAEGGWHALLIQSAAGAVFTVGSDTASVPVSGGSVVFTNGFAFAAAGGAEHAGVASNTLGGGGRLPTCLVRVAGDIVAMGNQCLHDREVPTGVLLQGSAVTASTNRVRGGKSMLVLQVPQARFAALGNLAARRYAPPESGRGPADALEAPQPDRVLNVTGRQPWP